MDSEDLQKQILELQKENAKLSRQLSRLQMSFDRNKVAAASVANITAMQNLEKRKQEQYMLLLLEISPNIILLLDHSGHIAYCTKTFLLQAGITYFATINGKHYREIFYQFADKAWVDDLESQLTATAQSQQSLEKEVSLNINGKGIRRYNLQFVSMIQPEFNFEGSIMMLYDVTEFRQMQENAEQANLAKSTFLSNMSHEIRTPMNAIIGMTAIAMSSDDNEKQKYCLTKIEEASTHLLGVINDVLDMSKIEANKFELSYVDCHLEKILQKVANIINFRVEERSQELSVRVDSRLPAIIETDEQRLSQVLTNLLSNAVKFTHDGGSIHLNTELLEEQGDLCVIKFEVTDTGIGITLEQQTRLFNSFVQADSSTSRKFGGTGLGLAISKRIVEMMGGTIWVQSDLNKGSTFAFTIKTKRKSVENTHVNSLRSDITIENLRLLVVDDSPEILEYFAHLTEKLHLHCDVAISGKDAYQMINANGSYDVYFIDWKMPEMDGIELTRRIKALGTDPSVVVMISATEWNVIEDEARAAGVDRFLQKPVFASMIINCINSYLGVKENIDKKNITFDGIFEGKRILLAEDVKINREIVKAQLAITKVQVDCAENGLETLEKFAAASDLYDMIFMDMQMPEMDGIEATQAIRALNLPKAKTIPIVAMTANVFREDIEKCLEAGMNDHIGKPLDFAVVVGKMKKYIYC
ncbi:MAG: response regulator [Planctomycetaceae bacterium]|jgi:signal transduction histidine kinase/DNA-binding response OmpR family regulator|nr:response regulator [Planctomycetaceae bacterium]